MYISTLKFFTSKSYAFNLFLLAAIVTSSFLTYTTICSLFIIKADGHESDEMQQSQNHSFKLVCYYNFPNDEIDLHPEGIPPDLCTHVNMAFVRINQTDFSIEIKPKQLQIIPRLIALKKKNKDLKIIISVGGGNNYDFSQMVKNHSNRKLFINSTMKFLKQYNLDGVDIDWEWPSRNGDTKEKIKFIQLLQEIRIEFDRHKKHYVLSAAVGALSSQIKMFYYARYIPKYVDYINLMSYDYHFYTSYYPITDYNAPLYASSKDRNFLFSDLNINCSVNFWEAESMPLDKIILGLPAFGHTYELVSSLNHDLHAPASGFGSIGDNGFIKYYEVCKFLKLLNTFQVVDKDAKVPYAYNQYDWISYDDEDSIATKAEFIVKQKLGGAMVYSLNSEDFAGICRKDKTKFPLLQQVKTVFNG